MEQHSALYREVVFLTMAFIVAATAIAPVVPPPPVPSDTAASGDGLDVVVSPPLNNTDSVKVYDEEIDFRYKNVFKGLKGCSPTKSCVRAGGYCVKAGSDCDGKLDKKGCKGNKKCKCCIPDQTTSPPQTCPVCSTCAATPTCPDLTTSSPQTCPPTQTCPVCSTSQATTISLAPQTSPPPTIHPAECIAAGGVQIGIQCLNFSEEALSWDDANKACTAKLGQLATLKVQPDAVANYANANYGGGRFWVGGSDAVNEGSWKWLDGQPFDDQFPWLSGQPNSFNGDQDCLEAISGGFGDGDCTTSIRYICEQVSGVPNGFELFNGRVIRRTNNNDTRSHYDAAMSFCNQFDAKPFIPRTRADYQLYKEVRSTLDQFMWLPANDSVQEGTLQWYTGEVASDISFWDWSSNTVMSSNSNDRDCLLYGGSIRLPALVHLIGCNQWSSYPPICERILS